MKYLVGVVIPIALQLLLVFIVVAANTGNGSWLGLAAVLLAVFSIPTTAIVNTIIVMNKKGQSRFILFSKCLISSALIPIVFLFLLAIS